MKKSAEEIKSEEIVEITNTPLDIVKKFQSIADRSSVDPNIAYKEQVAYKLFWLIEDNPSICSDIAPIRNQLKTSAYNVYTKCKQKLDYVKGSNNVCQEEADRFLATQFSPNIWGISEKSWSAISEAVETSCRKEYPDSNPQKRSWLSEKFRSTHAGAGYVALFKRDFLEGFTRQIHGVSKDEAKQIVKKTINRVYDS